MKRPTFKEQFDKLTRAYIAHKVFPFNNCACFVGNLLGGGEWAHVRYFHKDIPLLYDEYVLFRDAEAAKGLKFITCASRGFYTAEQIVDLEKTFLNTLTEEVGITEWAGKHEFIQRHPLYEEALFKAFEKALEMLRQIHTSKGEQVDHLEFTKRDLKKDTTVTEIVQ